MIERLLWYQDTPAGTTDLEYESYSKLQPMAYRGGLNNSGNGVTISSIVTTRGGFALLSVGDRIEIKKPGPDNSILKSKVTAVTSDSVIEIADAVDLSTVNAAAWFWQKRSKGTGSTAGWVSTGTLQTKSIKIHPGTLPTGGFNISIEGRYDMDQTPEIIYQRQYTAVTDFPQIIQVTEAIASLRVGLSRVSPGSDGSITISLYGNPTQ